MKITIEEEGPLTLALSPEDGGEGRRTTEHEKTATLWLPPSWR
jgi:hypothetical protein